MCEKKQKTFTTRAEWCINKVKRHVFDFTSTWTGSQLKSEESLRSRSSGQLRRLWRESVKKFNQVELNRVKIKANLHEPQGFWAKLNKQKNT